MECDTYPTDPTGQIHSFPAADPRPMTQLIAVIISSDYWRNRRSSDMFNGLNSLSKFVGFIHDFEPCINKTNKI
ncbi:hypothetical protein Hanom_Chr13g01228361 [Helianthus anomalus]